MFRLIDRLNDIVNSNKKRIAYKVNNDVITYNDLWNKANTLADSLRYQGNSPVIIYGHKSIDMVISIIACLIANRAYVPIDTYTPVSRIKQIIEITNSTLIIKNEILELKNIEYLNVKEVLEKYHQGTICDTTKNKIAYIIFTSGSTGEPKGVEISYENLENFINWISLNAIPDFCEITNVLNQASFSFDLSVADLYYSLFNGHTLVALEKVRQDEFKPIFDILNNEDINLMVITPTFIKLLLINNDFREEKFKSLKCIYFCGEQLEAIVVKKIKERFPNIVVINAYGPTEATSAVSSVVIDEKMFQNNYLPVGVIDKMAVDVEIVDEEIVLKGKSVFERYTNFDTSNCYKENGANCFKTGDIGFIEDGLLYCLGRKDNQIKYMGYRIELGDIENNLLNIVGISEAVVIGKYRENSTIVKSIKAFVTVEKDISIDFIKKELSKRIPNYMIPKSIEIIDRIPVNENGKYDRKKLREL